MAHRLAALLGVILVLAGCSRVQVNGSSVHTVNVGGRARVYRLYKPAGLSASAPLVVVLHGATGDARQAERAYGWDQLAESARFVVAYPDGVNRAWNVNGGGCCGRPARDNVDDIGFVSAAVADIGRNVSIDSSRVYATGMSNGAIMSYTMACNTGVFAAIGGVAGTQLDPCRSPRPASVMEIHGTSDRLVPYQGGQGSSAINGPSLPDVNAFWRNVDRCGTASDATNGGITTSTAGCADNRSVALVTIDGGGHQWPPFATQTLWEFFAAHPH